MEVLGFIVFLTNLGFVASNKNNFQGRKKRRKNEGREEGGRMKEGRKISKKNSSQRKQTCK